MAWTKGKMAAVAVVAVIILSGTITILVNFGAFSSRYSSETAIKLSRSSRIYTNGINEALRTPDRIYTYPAGDKATRLYIEAVFRRFNINLDVGRAIKSDRELTEEDIRSRMIVIYGSPLNHSFFQRVRRQLPLIFEGDGIVVGDKKCVGRDVGAIFICPNPVNPKNQMVIYGTVLPEALNNMNGVFHGPTDYVVFNNTTRQYIGLDRNESFLLMGAFNKSDPDHWRVDANLQLLPPKALQRATASVIVAR
jgi:hypothetical protein